MNYNQLCQSVTTSIVAAIESGDNKNWKAPWHNAGHPWAPINATTGAFYGGANIIALACAALDTQDHPEPWTSPHWATYKQWTAIGGQVRKGEHQTRIIKWIATKNKAGDAATQNTPSGQDLTSLHGPRLIPRTYGIFNAVQVDGWEPPAPQHHQPTPAVEAWITGAQADISYGCDQPRYVPHQDRIEVPALEQYDDPLDHYSTLCHDPLSALVG